MFNISKLDSQIHLYIELHGLECLIPTTEHL